MRDSQASDVVPVCPAAGAWVCFGGSAALCGAGGAAVKVRTCPALACSAGHCVAPDPGATCKRNVDCATGKICTSLLDLTGKPKLVCVAPAPGLSTPARCTSGLDCASGLCTDEGTCYYPCDGSQDCPSAARDCASVKVRVEGVEASLKTCRPD
ncbi:MAG: hypothetical protein IT371_26690 [Deltaproteobacteria bacterium]|nr:hypothetical protein [Deltaproteobacteria bacterium]